MAKLTLFFRNRVLLAHHLGNTPICIGRSSDCELIIDSLAVEERHAHVVPVGDGYEISPYGENIPVVVNHHPVEAHLLNHGDVIEIGKHTLSFAESAVVLATSPPPQRQEKGGADSTSTPELPIGCIQVMNGRHMGKVIPLQRALTRLALSKNHYAIVARRNDGYYLSHLEGDNPPSIEGNTIGDLTIQLKDGHHIELGGIEMLFIEEIAQAAAAVS